MAHKLGQRKTKPLVEAHRAMLALAWRTRDRQELLGQFQRLLAAVLATWLWVPVGNTGRSNVSPLKRVPLPTDLAKGCAASRGRDKNRAYFR